MLGTPVTFAPQFAIGDNGFIVTFDPDDLFMDTIANVQFMVDGDTTLTSLNSSEVSLATLNGYLSATTYPANAWTYNKSLLYLFLDSSSYPYLSTTKFIVFGTRTGMPITSMDDNIDVPEKHMELYMKYVIQEAAQLSGRQVPPSVIADIAELESNL